MNQIASTVGDNLDTLLANPWVSATVTLGLTMYAWKAAPDAPNFLEELLQNIFFRVFVCFLVLYIGSRDVMMSAIVAFVFVYGIEAFNNAQNKN